MSNMPFKLGTSISKFFRIRDELSFRNIRGAMWPALLIFPLSVILGDLRFFNLGIEAAGFQSWEIMLYFLGLGWLVVLFIPRGFIIPLLRISAIVSAVLIPFQLLLPSGISKLVFFMAFQFLNGICAACAFYIFSFKLNNVERLFGMSAIIFYYGFYYTIYREFSVVQDITKTWVGAIVMIIYLVVVFSLGKMKYDDHTDTKDGMGSGAVLVIGLHVVYYTIMSMINYIEWAEKIVYSLPYGLGSFASITLIIFIMLMSNRNAMYIWLMFLVFSLLGICILIYDSSAAQFSGSLIYGLGDGLGYIIVYYLCAGAIKRSKSFKMYKLFCVILFIEYFIISGALSRAFNSFEGSNHYIALGIVMVLCSICFLLLPLLQKKLFEADWTDGLYLRDMENYSQKLAETEERAARDNISLTIREEEILTLLLSGTSPKEIAFTLKISYDTARFHQKNLYRKLNINSIQELFSKYSVSATGNVI
jgi:DNA-binding CsgD family transcriptional regulator